MLSQNKIQLGKFEDLIGFTKPFVNQQPPIWQLERHFQWSFLMEDFYKKKHGAVELLAKEKKTSFLGQDLFWGEGNANCFYHAEHFSFLRGMEGIHMTDHLLGWNDN